MKTSRPFGVEIELKGYLRQNENRPGWVTSRRNYGHYGDIIEVQLAPGWKFTPDMSCGIEFVSPPIVDTSPIFKQLKYITDSGLDIDFRRCGLHVHVSCTDMEKPELAYIAKFCRHFDRTIFSYMHPLRLKDTFCRTLSKSDTTINMELNPARSLGVIERYKGCNIASYDTFGTVEFRYAESTLDYERICALIDLYIRIVEFSHANQGKRIKSPRNSKEKRIFLLDIIGMTNEVYRSKLLDMDYSVRTGKTYKP